MSNSTEGHDIYIMYWIHRQTTVEHILGYVCSEIYVVQVYKVICNQS